MRFLQLLLSLEGPEALDRLRQEFFRPESERWSPFTDAHIVQLLAKQRESTAQGAMLLLGPSAGVGMSGLRGGQPSSSPPSLSTRVLSEATVGRAPTARAGVPGSSDGGDGGGHTSATLRSRSSQLNMVEFIFAMLAAMPRRIVGADMPWVLLLGLGVLGEHAQSKVKQARRRQARAMSGGRSDLLARMFTGAGIGSGSAPTLGTVPPEAPALRQLLTLLDLQAAREDPSTAGSNGAAAAAATAAAAVLQREREQAVRSRYTFDGFLSGLPAGGRGGDAVSDSLDFGVSAFEKGGEGGATGTDPSGHNVPQSTPGSKGGVSFNLGGAGGKSSQGVQGGGSTFGRLTELSIMKARAAAARARSKYMRGRVRRMMALVAELAGLFSEIDASAVGLVSWEAFTQYVISAEAMAQEGRGGAAFVDPTTTSIQYATAGPWADHVTRGDSVRRLFWSQDVVAASGTVAARYGGGGIPGAGAQSSVPGELWVLEAGGQRVNVYDGRMRYCGSLDLSNLISSAPSLAFFLRGGLGPGEAASSDLGMREGLLRAEYTENMVSGGGGYGSGASALGGGSTTAALTDGGGDARGRDVGGASRGRGGNFSSSGHNGPTSASDDATRSVVVTCMTYITPQRMLAVGHNSAVITLWKVPEALPVIAIQGGGRGQDPYTKRNATSNHTHAHRKGGMGGKGIKGGKPADHDDGDSASRGRSLTPYAAPVDVLACPSVPHTLDHGYGLLYASFSADASVWVWHVASRCLIHRVVAHNDVVTHMLVLPTKTDREIQARTRAASIAAKMGSSGPGRETRVDGGGESSDEGGEAVIEGGVLDNPDEEGGHTGRKQSSRRKGGVLSELDGAASGEDGSSASQSRSHATRNDHNMPPSVAHRAGHRRAFFSGASAYDDSNAGGNSEFDAGAQPSASAASVGGLSVVQGALITASMDRTIAIHALAPPPPTELAALAATRRLQRANMHTMPRGLRQAMGGDPHSTTSGVLALARGEGGLRGGLNDDGTLPVSTGGAFLGRFGGHRRAVNHVTWIGGATPAGGILLSSGYDLDILAWDCMAMRQCGVLRGHRASVVSVVELPPEPRVSTRSRGVASGAPADWLSSDDEEEVAVRRAKAAKKFKPNTADVEQATKDNIEQESSASTSLARGQSVGFMAETPADSDGQGGSSSRPSLGGLRMLSPGTAEQPIKLGSAASKPPSPVKLRGNVPPLDRVSEAADTGDADGDQDVDPLDEVERGVQAEASAAKREHKKRKKRQNKQVIVTTLVPRCVSCDITGIFRIWDLGSAMGNASGRAAVPGGGTHSGLGVCLQVFDGARANLTYSMGIGGGAAAADTASSGGGAGGGSSVNRMGKSFGASVTAALSVAMSGLNVRVGAVRAAAMVAANMSKGGASGAGNAMDAARQIANSFASRGGPAQGGSGGDGTITVPSLGFMPRALTVIGGAGGQGEVVAGGVKLHRYAPLPLLLRDNTPVGALWNADSQTFLVAVDRSLRVYDVRGRLLKLHYNITRAPITCMVMSHAGRNVLIGQQDGSIQVHNFRSGRLIRATQAPVAALLPGEHAVDAPGGLNAALATAQREAKQEEMGRSGQEQVRGGGSGDPPSPPQRKIRKDSSQALLSQQHRAARQRRRLAQMEASDGEGRAGGSLFKGRPPPRSTLKGLAVTKPALERLAEGYATRTTAWGGDALGSELFEHKQNTTADVSLLGNQAPSTAQTDSAVVARAPQNTRFYGANSGKGGSSLPPHTKEVTAIVYVRSSVGVSKGGVSTAQNAAAHTMRRRKGGEGPSENADASGGGASELRGHNRIVSAGWDRRVAVCQDDEGAVGGGAVGGATDALVASRIAVNAHGADIVAMAHSPSLQLVASGSSDGIVRVWDSQTLIPEATLVGHTAGITAIAFFDFCGGAPLVSVHAADAGDAGGGQRGVSSAGLARDTTYSRGGGKVASKPLTAPQKAAWEEHGAEIEEDDGSGTGVAPPHGHVPRSVCSKVKSRLGKQQRWAFPLLAVADSSGVVVLWSTRPLPHHQRYRPVMTLRPPKPSAGPGARDPSSWLSYVEACADGEFNEWNDRQIRAEIELAGGESSGGGMSKRRGGSYGAPTRPVMLPTACECHSTVGFGEVHTGVYRHLYAAVRARETARQEAAVNAAGLSGRSRTGGILGLGGELVPLPAPDLAFWGDTYGVQGGVDASGGGSALGFSADAAACNWGRGGAHTRPTGPLGGGTGTAKHAQPHDTPETSAAGATATSSTSSIVVTSMTVLCSTVSGHSDHADSAWLVARGFTCPRLDKALSEGGAGGFYTPYTPASPARTTQFRSVTVSSASPRDSSWVGNRSRSDRGGPLSPVVGGGPSSPTDRDIFRESGEYEHESAPAAVRGAEFVSTVRRGTRRSGAMILGGVTASTLAERHQQKEDDLVAAIVEGGGFTKSIGGGGVAPAPRGSPSGFGSLDDQGGAGLLNPPVAKRMLVLGDDAGRLSVLDADAVLCMLRLPPVVSPFHLLPGAPEPTLPPDYLGMPPAPPTADSEGGGQGMRSGSAAISTKNKLAGESMRASASAHADAAAKSRRLKLRLRQRVLSQLQGDSWWARPDVAAPSANSPTSRTPGPQRGGTSDGPMDEDAGEASEHHGVQAQLLDASQQVTVLSSWTAHGDSVTTIQPIAEPPSLLSCSVDLTVKLFSAAGEPLGVLEHGKDALGTAKVAGMLAEFPPSPGKIVPPMGVELLAAARAVAAVVAKQRADHTALANAARAAIWGKAPAPKEGAGGSQARKALFQNKGAGLRVETGTRQTSLGGPSVAEHARSLTAQSLHAVLGNESLHVGGASPGGHKRSISSEKHTSSSRNPLQVLGGAVADFNSTLEHGVGMPEHIDAEHLTPKLRGVAIALLGLVQGLRGGGGSASLRGMLQAAGCDVATLAAPLPPGVSGTLLNTAALHAGAVHSYKFGNGGVPWTWGKSGAAARTDGAGAGGLNPVTAAGGLSTTHLMQFVQRRFAWEVRRRLAAVQQEEERKSSTEAMRGKRHRRPPSTSRPSAAGGGGGTKAVQGGVFLTEISDITPHKLQPRARDDADDGPTLGQFSAAWWRALEEAVQGVRPSAAGMQATAGAHVAVSTGSHSPPPGGNVDAAVHAAALPGVSTMHNSPVGGVKGGNVEGKLDTGRTDDGKAEHMLVQAGAASGVLYSHVAGKAGVTPHMALRTLAPLLKGEKGGEMAGGFARAASQQDDSADVRILFGMVGATGADPAAQVLTGAFEHSGGAAASLLGAAGISSAAAAAHTRAQVRSRVLTAAQRRIGALRADAAQYDGLRPVHFSREAAFATFKLAQGRLLVEAAEREAEQQATAAAEAEHVDAEHTTNMNAGRQVGSALSSTGEFSRHGVPSTPMRQSEIRHHTGFGSVADSGGGDSPRSFSSRTAPDSPLGKHGESEQFEEDTLPLFANQAGRHVNPKKQPPSPDKRGTGGVRSKRSSGSSLSRKSLRRTGNTSSQRSKNSSNRTASQRGQTRRKLKALGKSAPGGLSGGYRGAILGAINGSNGVEEDASGAVSVEMLMGGGLHNRREGGSTVRSRGLRRGGGNRGNDSEDSGWRTSDDEGNGSDSSEESLHLRPAVKPQLSALQSTTGTVQEVLWRGDTTASRGVKIDDITSALALLPQGSSGGDMARGVKARATTVLKHVALVTLFSEHDLQQDRSFMSLLHEMIGLEALLLHYALESSRGARGLHGEEGGGISSLAIMNTSSALQQLRSAAEGGGRAARADQLQQEQSAAAPKGGNTAENDDDEGKSGDTRLTGAAVDGEMQTMLRRSTPGPGDLRAVVENKNGPSAEQKALDPNAILAMLVGVAEEDSDDEGGSKFPPALVARIRGEGGGRALGQGGVKRMAGIPEDIAKALPLDVQRQLVRLGIAPSTNDVERAAAARAMRSEREASEMLAAHLTASGQVPLEFSYKHLQAELASSKGGSGNTAAGSMVSIVKSFRDAQRNKKAADAAAEKRTRQRGGQSRDEGGVASRSGSRQSHLEASKSAGALPSVPNKTTHPDEYVAWVRGQQQETLFRRAQHTMGGARRSAVSDGDSDEDRTRGAIDVAPSAFLVAQLGVEVATHGSRPADHRRAIARANAARQRKRSKAAGQHQTVPAGQDSPSMAAGAGRSAVSAATSAMQRGDTPGTAAAGTRALTAQSAGGALAQVTSLLEDETAARPAVRRGKSGVKQGGRSFVPALLPVRSVMQGALERGASTGKVQAGRAGGRSDTDLRKRLWHTGASPAPGDNSFKGLGKEQSELQRLTSHAKRVAETMPLSASSPRAEQSLLLAAAETTKSLGADTTLWMLGEGGFKSLTSQEGGGQSHSGGPSSAKVVKALQDADRQARAAVRSRVGGGSSAAKGSLSKQVRGSDDADSDAPLNDLQRAAFVRSLNRAYADRQMASIRAIIREGAADPPSTPLSEGGKVGTPHTPKTLSPGRQLGQQNAAVLASSALSPPVKQMLDELALHKKLPPPRRRQGGGTSAAAAQAHIDSAVFEPSIETGAGGVQRQATSDTWSSHGGLVALDALRIGRALNTLLLQARVPSDIARALPPAIAAPIRALLGPVVEAASRGRGTDSSAKGEGLGIAPLAGSGTEAKDNRARISTAVQLLQQHATKVYAHERAASQAYTPGFARKQQSFDRS